MTHPDTPTVTVTMLGASGSGKSTFMLGMYAILAGGIAGYFTHAPHNQHVQLMGSWDRLNDDGKLPPPNAEQPITYQSDGVTTLLQPVQLGEFGTDTRTDTVDVDTVAPRDLEKPFIFSFLEYLSTRIEEETEFLEVVGRRQADTEQQLATLRGRFGASIFFGSRLDRLTGEQQALVADAEAKRQALQQMGRQAEQLRPDLHNAWVIRNEPLR